MYCPQCRSEYRSGFTHCAECNVALVDQLEPENAGALNDAELVVVRTYSDETEASLAKTALEASSIECMIRSDDYGGLTPLSLTRGVDLLVRSEDFEKADEILSSDVLPEDADVPDAN